MSKKPKVSIIIPVYNGSNFLSESINSALSQTYENIEIVVINDGSKDWWKTEKIAKSYWNKIKYYSKSNWGVASALNLWIEKMTWDYFSWLSHDDLYFPEKVQKQIEFLENLNYKKNVILYSNYIFIDEEGKEINKINLKYNEKEFLYKLTINSFLNGCTLLIPKIAFYEVGFFENTLKTTQDYHLWFRMLKTYHFINVPKYLVKSRQHAEQDSKTKILKAMKERRILERFIFRTYSLSELKNSAGSKLPAPIFYFLTILKLEKYRILWFLYLIAQKLHIDLFLAKIYRKIFKF